MSDAKSERSDFDRKPSVKKSERSYKESTTDKEERLLTAIKYKGSITANYGANILGIKYDTAKNYLEKMVKKGILRTKVKGSFTHYVLVPKSEKIGTFHPQPDIKKGKDKTDGYGRVSVTRATTPEEVIRVKGFVCHANVLPEKVSDAFIRSHHNGQYEVKIIQKGQMVEGSHYIPIPNTDQSIVVNWRFTDLQGFNTQCLCNIKIPTDRRVFALRAVSTKAGELNKMSVWVHPRYIYNIGVIETTHAEFIQQVNDLLDILRSEGWDFDKDITFNGEHHYAFNDTMLGSLVSNYERDDNNPIVFDHSHGVNEMEIIETDGDTEKSGQLVECIANLPSILQNVSMSFTEVTKSLVELSKQVQIISKIQVDSLQAQYAPERPYTHDEGNMYG